MNCIRVYFAFMIGKKVEIMRTEFVATIVSIYI